jgi:D-alanyl-D-alanine carboxypeptidase
VIVSKKIPRIVILMTCAFGVLQAGVPGVSATSLKPLDRSALQDTVNATAKELMVPGAMVLLRTPQGQFIVGYGTTELGRAISPGADTHFRIASNTKPMTSAVSCCWPRKGN